MTAGCVLFVLPQRHYGGLHRLVQTLSEPLRAEGFEPLAIVPRDSGLAGELGRSLPTCQSGRLATLPSPRRGMFPFLRHLGESRWAARSLRDVVTTRPDIVHVFGLLDTIGPSYARQVGAELVRSANSSLVPSWAAPMARFVFGRAAGSLYEGTGLRRMYGPSRSVRPSGVFYPACESITPISPDERRTLRTLLGVPPEALLVSTWSNITPQKGLSHFVQYAKHAAPRLPNMHFMIAGTPASGHEEHLTALRRDVDSDPGIRDRFHFAVEGELTRETAFGVIDAFALTSEFEGVATATVEAMTSGVPVIAHDVGSVGDLVQSGATGNLVPLGDADAFRAALTRVDLDRQTTHDMVDAAKRLTDSRCSIDALSSSFIGVYRAVMADRSPARATRNVDDHQAFCAPHRNA